MKHHILLTFTTAALLACVFTVNTASAKPGKGHKPDASKPEPSGNTSPKAQLSPYIDRLSELLALRRAQNGPFFTEAPGHLTVMKATYAARQAKAESAEATRLAGAVATCDALIAALNERQQIAGQISANTTIGATGNLGRRRKDNFSEGTVGPEFARYQDVKEQARRERKRNLELKQAAAKDDPFLNHAAVNRWTERTIELQQQIATLYARIG